MTNSQLKITPSPRTEPCHARFEMDEDISFTCAFTYPERKARPANLSEEISAAQGNDWEAFRARMGDAEFSFSRYQSEGAFRLDEIYAYTNPAQWQRTSLGPVPQGALASAFTFTNVPEGEPVFTLTEICAFQFDEGASRLRLLFAAETSITKWFQIADNVFIALDDANGLIALQIEGVTL